MNGKKFSWLPVLLISLIVQSLAMITFVYLEARIFPSSFTFVLTIINILPVALTGGMVANHYYIKHSLDIGGVSASLYYVFNFLILGYDLLSFGAIAILLITYYVGCFGAYLYNEKQVKSLKTD